MESILLRNCLLTTGKRGVKGHPVEAAEITGLLPSLSAGIDRAKAPNWWVWRYRMFQLLECEIYLCGKKHSHP
jgi:hypothetical protein